MGLFGKKQSSGSPQPFQGRQPLDRNPSFRRTQAFSYHAQRSNSQENVGRGTDHIVPRDSDTSGLAWWQRPAVLLLSGGFIVSAVLYGSLLSTEPTINTESQAASAYFLQDTSVYQRTVSQSLQASLLNRSQLTLNENQIKQDLQKQYPEVAQVTIQKPLLSRSLRVTITPSAPSFILTTTDSKAFLLDGSGRALVSASQIDDSGELAVPTLHDASGLTVELGSQALPRSVIAFAVTVTQALRTEDVAVTSLTLPKAASELDVALTGLPYIAKFNLQDDPLQQAGAFLAAKARLERDKTQPSSYIDVRVPERAYYK